MPRKKSHINEMLRILKSTYPDVNTQLKHKNPFQLLIATILSAQCTDLQVNRVTPELFRTLATPADFAGASLDSIETLIHSTGFFHNKAKNIQNCARTLVEKFQGTVPQTLEELVTLPGVGRKTANVVRGAAFSIPGMVVDTHVARISRRLEFTKHKDPVKIEFDLMKVIPEADWNEFGLQLIYFGRVVCSARKPRCSHCPLCHLCNSPEKTL